MEGLKNAREETGKTRAELGAVDLRPGEVEGMNVGSGKSAALEKRKRDLEERRKLVDAKRRKKIGSPPAGEAREIETATQAADRPSQAEPAKAAACDPADDFLAKLERDLMTGRAR